LAGLRGFQSAAAADLVDILNLQSFEEQFNFKFYLFTSCQCVLRVLAELINLTDNLQNSFHPRVGQLIENLGELSFFENSAYKSDDQLAVFVIFESDQQ
jgi:hypothetical protein